MPGQALRLWVEMTHCCTFCSARCKARFEADPGAFARPAPVSVEDGEASLVDPVCGMKTRVDGKHRFAGCDACGWPLRLSSRPPCFPW